MPNDQERIPKRDDESKKPSVGNEEQNKEKRESSPRGGGEAGIAEETRLAARREHLERAFMETVPVSEDEKKALFERRRKYFPNESEKTAKEFIELWVGQQEKGGRQYLTVEEKQRISSGSRKQRWQAIDEILSEIYAKADQYPQEHFHACFDLNQQIKLTEIAQAVMQSKEDATEFTARMHAIHSMREVVHNAMYLIEGGKGGVDEMSKMMRGVPSHLSDVLFVDAHGVTNGVGTTHRLYEDMFEKFRMDQIRAKGENWIPPEKLFLDWRTGESAIDTRVRALFKRALQAGAVDGIKWKEEQIDQKKTGAEGGWPEWKINRALHLGRAYGAITARFPEIVASTRLQDDPKRLKRLISPYAEDFIRTFNPIENLVRKFGIGRPMAYLNYLFSSGEQKIYKDTEEIVADFDKLTDIKEVMKKTPEERAKIPNMIWNLFAIDSRSGGVRVTKAAAEEMIKKEQQDFIGVNNRLGLVETKGAAALREIQGIWDFALKRTPLIVLKGILQFNPELQNEINQAAGISDSEVDGIEDWLLVLKEEAVRYLKPELDYGLITDREGRENQAMADKVRRYAEAVRKKIWEKGYLGGKLEELNNPNREVKKEYLIDTKGDMKKIFPFVIAVSDLPFEELDFIRTGHIWNIGRRWRDIGGASKAQAGFMAFIPELPRLKKVDDYKRAMKPIYDGVNEFDHNIAQGFMRYMAEMICQANQKLPLDQWLPAPLEKLLDPLGWVQRQRSYTQKIFGSEAAVWDRFNARQFIQGLGEEDYINSLGEGESNHEETLLKKLKGRRRDVILEGFVRYGPIAIGLILFFLAQELKKQFEEELKKA